MSSIAVVRRARLRWYLVVLFVACVVPVGAVVRGHWGGLEGTDSAELWVLAALASVASFRPIRLAWGNRVEDLMLSGAFTFAALLLFGLPAAMVVDVVAMVVGNVVDRRRPVAVVFNALQSVLCITAAGITYEIVAPGRLGTDGVFDGLAVLALVCASVVYLVTNATLVAFWVALPQGWGVLPIIWRGICECGALGAAEYALAPVVAVVVSTEVWMVSILAIPLIAVAKGASATAASHYQATHDPLTSLPNRAFLHSKIEEAVSGASPEQQLAVLLIDLDGFKEVNDTLGHHVGDMLLKAVGARLQDTAGENINIARLGGDEFATVLPVTDREEAAAFAERLVGALEEPFVVDDVRLDIEGSVGIAVFPDHAADRDTLLQRADVAMYRAKQLRSRVETYDSEFDPSSPRRLALLGELRHAIPNGELVLHYQPKIDLRTLTVVGVEALVRWHHPERGFTPPDEFIPLAERTGLITPLTEWVTEAALAQHQEWRTQGLDVAVAVNVSVRNLHDPGFADRVAASLDRWDVPASRLKLEITEGTLMADPRRVMEVLEALHHMGVALALDDFGTGYSSLAYLKRLPVRELKIDRSFVMHMTEDPDDSAIVRTTIDLARSLGLHVVAEGVENQDAMELLAMFGCHQAQGYYISRPLPAEAATSFLHGSSRTGSAMRGEQALPADRLVLPWTSGTPATVAEHALQPVVPPRAASGS